jgi:uridine kinase
MNARLGLSPAMLVAGLVPRLLLALLAVPLTHDIWFVPFLTKAGIAIDPWTNFLSTGGDPAAFPYGILFVAAYQPATWLGGVLGGVYGAHLGLTLAVLFWELVLVAAIAAVGGNERSEAAAKIYWLSPIPIYVGYWHGQLDVFPTALMILGFAAVQVQSWRRAGMLLGAAAAAKLSMAVSLPFVMLYLLGRRRLHAFVPRFVIYLAATMLLLAVPFAFFHGYREMVLGTPEMLNIFAAKVAITEELDAYLLPLAFLGLFYWAWRIRRLNFEMLWTLVGLAFLALFLFTTAAPGWMMWLMPFMAMHVADRGFMHRVVYWVFAAAYIAMQLTQASGAHLISGPDLTAPLAQMSPLFRGRTLPILETLLLSAGLAMGLQMGFSGILYQSFHLASRRPFAIGVAGDSGTGKDTLMDALQDLFGRHASSRLSGDDYHLWDRQNPMWQAVTHLHPKGNDVDVFNRNVLALVDGQSAVSRHYDHSSGRSGLVDLIPSREIVLVSGLHALWSPTIADRFHVRVFMDMDEDLRRFLKLRRDVTVRGYPPEKVLTAIERRQSDRERFILPQAEHADIVFRLEPRHASAIADIRRPIDTGLLRLIVIFRRGKNFDEPTRLLMALCGVYVTESPLDDGRLQLLIEGEPTADDVAALARRLVPGMADFIAVEPKWHAAMTGIMQLIILHELDSVRRKRASRS